MHATTAEQRKALRTAQEKTIELILPADLEFPWSEDELPDPRMFALLRLVFVGVDMATARSFARVDSDTYAVWLRKGGSSRSKSPDPVPDPADFADCLELAEACAKARAVWVITAGVLNGNIDAAKFWLEKRHRSAYGPGMDVQLDSGDRALFVVLLPDNGRGDAALESREEAVKELTEEP